MDNFNINMTAQGPLKEVMELIFKKGGIYGCYGYAVRPKEVVLNDRTLKPLRLVFFQYEDRNKTLQDMVAFPFKMDASGVADFAERWLESVDYGKEPDHDGDNGKGWTVYNDYWGHVDSQYQAFIAVTPTWAMYGK